MMFIKTKVDTLAGKTEVIFTLQTHKEDPEFKIIANGAGVRFEGTSPEFYGSEGAEVLARTIGAAFTEYQRLRPKFATNLSGH